MLGIAPLTLFGRPSKGIEVLLRLELDALKALMFDMLESTLEPLLLRITGILLLMNKALFKSAASPIKLTLSLKRYPKYRPNIQETCTKVVGNLIHSLTTSIPNTTNRASVIRNKIDIVT